MHSSVVSAISPVLGEEMTMMTAVVEARPPSRRRPREEAVGDGSSPQPGTGLVAIPGKSTDGETALCLLNTEATPKDMFNSTPMCRSYTNVICTQFPHSRKFAYGKTVLGFQKSMPGTKQGEEPRVRVHSPS